MNPVATLWRVTIHFTWQDKNEKACEYTCGSYKGSRELLKREKHRAAGSGEMVDWFSIEERNYYPCEDGNPEGQLYIGMGHYEFKEFHWNREAKR